MVKSQILIKIKNLFKKLFNSNKKIFVVVVIIFILLIISTFSFGTNKDSQSISDEINDTNISNYTQVLENKISKILLSVSQINKAEVLILTKSSPVINYLTESETITIENTSGTTTTTTTKVVYKKEGSNNMPIEISTTFPDIIGVLIFTNKIDSSTKYSIINVISSVLNIDTTCINILQEN